LDDPDQELIEESAPMTTKQPGRPLTPVYCFFYLLFSPDTWRVLLGLALAWLALPFLAPSDLPALSRILLLVMLTAIGWTLTAVPGRGIAGFLQKMVGRKGTTP
jgi:hypothetical protein